MENLEKIKEFLSVHPEIRVDTSSGYWRGNSRYWDGGEKITYTLSPDVGVVISVHYADGRGANWTSHDQYFERACLSQEAEYWERANFLRYVDKLVDIVEEYGLYPDYDFSVWEDLTEEEE